MEDQAHAVAAENTAGDAADSVLAADAAQTKRPRAFSLAWGGAGLLFFGLGAVGVVLPILPTTPFMLLAAFCFARSSRRLNEWFKSTKLYHSVLEGYVTKREMTISAKLKVLIPVTALLIIAIILMRKVLVGQIVLAVVLVAHIVYFGFIVKTDRGGA